MSNSLENPLVSIIVPVYKVEEYLAKCLDSIIGQTYQNLEIILIDDGSPDNCGNICDYYAAKDKRIIVIHQENKGLSAARNAGLDICTGAYIVFVDSDDWVESNYIEAMMKYVDETTIVNCGYVRYNQHQFDIICSNHFLSFQNYEVLEQYVKMLLTRKSYFNFSVWAKFFPRRVFNDLRFPNGKNYEDLYLNAEIIQKVPTYIVLDKWYYHHLVREGSICRTYTMKNFMDYVDAYIKHENDLLKVSADKNSIRLFSLNGLIGILATLYEHNLDMSQDYAKHLKNHIQERYKLVNSPGLKLCIMYYTIIYTPTIYLMLKKIWHSQAFSCIKDCLCK